MKKATDTVVNIWYAVLYKTKKYTVSRNKFSVKLQLLFDIDILF
jgi:hypothetical protein